LVAVVTGCNCGIGKQIVRELNIRGAKLGCNPDRLIFKCLDLAKFASIWQVAREIEQVEDHIDLLINNAGIFLYPKFKLTDDGHELVWQTNYLGHFLLTELLVPSLSKAPSARIVNVSALAHYYSDNLDLHLVDRRDGWDSRSSYARSKLALVMYSFELTKRLRASNQSNISVNSCHPGISYTRIIRHTPLARKPLNFIFAPLMYMIYCRSNISYSNLKSRDTLCRSYYRWFFLKTPKDGAQTPLYLALSKRVAGVSGKYFVECSQKEPLTMKDWDKRCEDLYEYSIEVCGLQNYVRI
uniref:Retinol dehydrogenase 14 n=1 Tax=Dracunculus medinensis TaxID=318479 RepID=A0A0N4U0Z7_DRAME